MQLVNILVYKMSTPSKCDVGKIHRSANAAMPATAFGPCFHLTSTKKNARWYTPSPRCPSLSPQLLYDAIARSTGKPSVLLWILVPPLLSIRAMSHKPSTDRSQSIVVWMPSVRIPVQVCLFCSLHSCRVKHLNISRFSRGFAFEACSVD